MHNQETAHKQPELHIVSGHKEKLQSHLERLLRRYLYSGDKRAFRELYDIAIREKRSVRLSVITKSQQQG